MLTLKLSENGQILNLTGYTLPGVALLASPDSKLQVKKGIFHCPKTCTQTPFIASHAKFSKTKTNPQYSLKVLHKPSFRITRVIWVPCTVVTLFRNSSTFELCWWRWEDSRLCGAGECLLASCLGILSLWLFWVPQERLCNRWVEFCPLLGTIFLWKRSVLAGMTSSPVFLHMMKRHLPADGSSILVKSMLSLRIDSDPQPSEGEVEGRRG